jgi:hypothetical protein
MNASERISPLQSQALTKRGAHKGLSLTTSYFSRRTFSRGIPPNLDLLIRRQRPNPDDQGNNDGPQNTPNDDRRPFVPFNGRCLRAPVKFHFSLSHPSQSGGAQTPRLILLTEFPEQQQTMDQIWP